MALFADVKFYSSGDVPERAREALKAGGAERANYFTEFVTHLIWGRGAAEADLAAAEELYEIPAASAKWVAACARLGRRVSPRPYGPPRGRLFSGVVACAARVSPRDAAALYALLTYHGGELRLRLDAGCTHLVCGAAEGERYARAERLRIRTVTPDWVCDSVRAKELRPPDAYHPSLLEPDADSTMALVDKLKRRMPSARPPFRRPEPAQQRPATTAPRPPLRPPVPTQRPRQPEPPRGKPQPRSDVGRLFQRPPQTPPNAAPQVSAQAGPRRVPPRAFGQQGTPQRLALLQQQPGQRPQTPAATQQAQTATPQRTPQTQQTPRRPSASQQIQQAQQAAMQSAQQTPVQQTQQSSVQQAPHGPGQRAQQTSSQQQTQQTGGPQSRRTPPNQIQRSPTHPSQQSPQQAIRQQTMGQQLQQMIVQQGMQHVGQQGMQHVAQQGMHHVTQQGMQHVAQQAMQQQSVVQQGLQPQPVAQQGMQQQPVAQQVMQQQPVSQQGMQQQPVAQQGMQQQPVSQQGMQQQPVSQQGMQQQSVSQQGMQQQPVSQQVMQQQVVSQQGMQQQPVSQQGMQQQVVSQQGMHQQPVSQQGMQQQSVPQQGMQQQSVVHQGMQQQSVVQQGMQQQSIVHQGMQQQSVVQQGMQQQSIVHQGMQQQSIVQQGMQQQSIVHQGMQQQSIVQQGMQQQSVVQQGMQQQSVTQQGIQQGMQQQAVATQGMQTIVGQLGVSQNVQLGAAEPGADHQISQQQQLGPQSVQRSPVRGTHQHGIPQPGLQHAVGHQQLQHRAIQQGIGARIAQQTLPQQGGQQTVVRQGPQPTVVQQTVAGQNVQQGVPHQTTQRAAVHPGVQQNVPHRTVQHSLAHPGGQQGTQQILVGPGAQQNVLHQGAQQNVVRQGPQQNVPQGQVSQQPDQQTVWQQQQFRQQRQQQIVTAQPGAVGQRLSWGPGRHLIHLDAQTHAQLQQMDPQQRALFVAHLQKRGQLSAQRAAQQQTTHPTSHTLTLVRGPLAQGVGPHQQVQWVQQGVRPADQSVVQQPLQQQPLQQQQQQPTLQQTQQQQQFAQLQLKQQHHQRLQRLQNRDHLFKQAQPQIQSGNVPVNMPPQGRQIINSNMADNGNQLADPNLVQQGIPPDQVIPAGASPLLVNPRTKTALANLLNIRLQNTQVPHPQDVTEPSAAGTLRLMTAAHNAPPRAPTEVVQTLQQRRVLSGNQTPSHHQLPASPHTHQQLSKPPYGIPMGGGKPNVVGPPNRTAPAPAPAVPAAALPRVQFYGHNPNLKLPPDLFLLGCIFHIVEYGSDPEHDIKQWTEAVGRHGGEVEPGYCPRVTHVLAQTQKHGVVMQALRDAKRCVTAYWLSDTMSKKQVIPPWQALHLPLMYAQHDRPAQRHRASITGFSGEERDRVYFMLEHTGAKVTNYMSKDNTVLICRRPEGLKYQRAREWGIPIVSVQWVTDLLLGNMSALTQLEHSKYQQFNVNNQFRIDYTLVPHLMNPWKMPINITQESHERVKRGALPTVGSRQIKKPRLMSPAPVPAMTTVVCAELPDPAEAPRVLFSSIKDIEPFAHVVKQLGGFTVSNPSEATHLVMGRLVRTPKFILALIRVKHVLSTAWILESQKMCKFAEESKFQLRDKYFEETFKCDIGKVVSTPVEERTVLFSGITFYMTPGVQPGRAVLTEMIEMCGGRVDKNRKSYISIQESHKEKPYSYIVLTAMNDLHLVYYLLQAEKNLNIVCNTELVLASIMRQKVQVLEHLVKIN